MIASVLDGSSPPKWWKKFVTENELPNEIKMDTIQPPVTKHCARELAQHLVPLRSFQACLLSVIAVLLGVACGI